MPAAAQLTIADLERMPDDGIHRELLFGELIELPPPKSGHSRIARKLQRAIDAHAVGLGLGEAYCEAGFKLFPDRRTWLQPDVSFVQASRLRHTDADDYFEGAPDLAVEIISRSESASDIETKIQAYLAAGAIAIWAVYPGTRTIRVIRRDRVEATLTEQDLLADSELFPGWQMPVRDVFGG